MVQKRPLVVDSYVVSSKHPKFDESRQLVSFLEFTSKDVGWKPYTSGNGYDGSTICLVECNEDSETCNATHLPKVSAEKSSGGNSNSSWASSCISVEDISPEASFDILVSSENDDSHYSSHILVSPEKYDYDYPSRTLAHSRDPYTYLLELPPKKLVPIGLDYQAELPYWCPHGASDASNCHTGKLILSPQISRVRCGDHLIDDNKFLGTCLTPMPGVEPSVCHNDRIGREIVCGCVDPGSVTCVRQHIVETREELRRMVGHETFVGLGFQEMGEIVAEKWSSEDEQVFREVVISNPSSTGKNFWDCLSAVFPSRTKNEIVSYYYNVFILRRRAKQNRCDSMNIDSDDDEWQESEDECAESDDDDAICEDEDSVESPACRGIPLWSKIYNDSHEYASGIAEDGSRQYNVDLASSLQGVTTGLKTCPLIYSGTDDMFFPSQETLLDVWGCHVSNDHLLSSSGTGAEHQASQSMTDQGRSSSATYDGVSAKGGCEYFLPPCDAKLWDFRYSSCPGNDVDFLPTCYMIEEVFGVGDSNKKAGDDKLV